MKVNLKILVVDDDQRMVKTLADIFKTKGFDVIGANSGEEALEIIQKQKFDCVLTDIKMPGINGVEMFKSIKKIDADVPVVFMTAFATDKLVQEGLDNGAITSLTKPLNIENVLAFFSSLQKESTIAIVDDDISFRETLGEVLEARGFKVDQIEDLDNVPDHIADESQIILLDLKLDKLSGYDVLTEIRKDHPDTPVVMVTGFRDEMSDIINKAYEINAFTCLYKPFELKELLGVLKKIKHEELRKVLS